MRMRESWKERRGSKASTKQLHLARRRTPEGKEIIIAKTERQQVCVGGKAGAQYRLKRK